MKKQLFKILILVFTTLPLNLHASDNDFGLWGYTQFKYNFSKNVYGSTHIEYRSKQNTSRTDCFIMRQYLGYKWCKWLKTDIAYDYIDSPSSVYHRGLFSVTANHKEGNFNISLRERYLYEYKVSTRSGENILRSKGTVSYSIPNTILSPYAAVELFTWKHWMKTRHYLGTHVKLNKQSSLDLFYMYYTKADNKPTQHILGAGYIVKF